MKLFGKDLICEFQDATHADIVIAGNTDCTIDLSSNTIDATTKDDDDAWESLLPASKSWSVSWNGLIIETSSGTTTVTYDSNAKTIIGAFMNSTPITVFFNIGHISYKGTGIITATNFSGAVKDLAKASFTLTGQGGLIQGTKTTSISSGSSGN